MQSRFTTKKINIMKKKAIIIGLAAIVVISGLILLPKACKKETQKYTFETVKVTKGSVSNTVTATGTLEALKTVDVGTQVSGIIDHLYADYNSVVKKGQLLAELDKTSLLATLKNAEASLDDAKAELTYQTSIYNRTKALYDKNLVSQTEYDLALYNYSKAVANTKIVQANYDKAKVNLSYATIYSPIDGVVLSREVSEGQTVAATMSTPTLFSIANDLTLMQVEANIDEADIGQVKMGQRVEFTVDAFSDLKFSGKVTEIRLESTVTSNVVTYTVIIQAANPDKKLMPGMTANITIVVEEALNALTIPVKATQFSPDSASVVGYLNSLPKEMRPDMQMPQNGKGPQDRPSGMPMMRDSTKTISEVWVKTDKLIHPVPVETGVSDGVNIEVKNGLKEGDEIIVNMTADGEKVASAAKSSSSPFMPKPPQDKKTSQTKK
jgi:HlyD family secretion protein